MDFSPPGSSVHGFPRQEYWSGLTFLPPGDLPDPGMEYGTCIGRWILYHWATSEAIGICEHALKAGEEDKQFGVIDNRLLSHKHAHAQLCPTLFDPTNCSPPGSSVHGISQARILEWVDIFFSRGSSQPRDWTWVSCTAGRFFTTIPPGKPNNRYRVSFVWQKWYQTRLWWWLQNSVTILKTTELCPLSEM